MSIYRFAYDGARITFVCPPRDALYHAARFARYLRRELVAISEIRALPVQLRLV